jgi:hypothetical protein
VHASAWRRAGCAAVLLVGLGAATPAAAQDVGQRGDSVFVRHARFEGTVRMADSLQRMLPLRVSIHNYILPNRTRMARFPGEGLRVVQLRGGELATVIGGERRERAEGEFWTVPAGVAMGVETGDDAAVIQVVTVEGG